MIKKTKILYLYSEIVGYNIPVFKEYVNNYNAEVHVVHWDHKKLKPYDPEEIAGVFYYKRSEYDFKNILDLAKKIDPAIIYISGWMDKDYLKVTKIFKKRGIPVVTGFDDIWFGNLRQRIASIIFPFYYKKYFTHAWIAGSLQFEFARKLGFERNKIIFDLLSCDTDFFQKDNEDIELKNNFIYVGNFRRRKGTDILMKAFDLYKNKYNGEWNLIVVGNGEQEDIVKNRRGVMFHPFSTSKEVKVIAKGAGVFILPSRHDQWGVVVHEFCCLGFPLIVSDNVGAKTSFLIDGYNGYSFQNENVDDLAKKMDKISKIPQVQLKKMGNNSKLLSKRISVESSAANFMSILSK